MKKTDFQSTDAVEYASLVLLVLVAFLAGQTGIPVEDGGEIITVARLGGVCHPPGMPLVALLARCSWVLFGLNGPGILFALTTGTSLWLLSRKLGLPVLILAAGMIMLPAFRERLLLWDAYSSLFLIFAIGLTAGRISSLAAGFLTGIAVAIHPQGILLPLVLRTDRFSPLPALGGFIAGVSLFLALPLGSAAGTVVDWGAAGHLGSFIRQVGARGYREVYGSSIGAFTFRTLGLYASSIWRMMWPVLLVPSVIGIPALLRRNRVMFARAASLILVDMLYVLLVNPMAAGTSQTGILTLFAFSVLSVNGLRFLADKRIIALALGGAVLLSGILSENPIKNQRDGIERFFAPAPLDAGFFVSSNDRLYGGWMLKYVEDRRPDIALLSTDNFAGWFEDMAVHFNNDLDLTEGVEEVGGIALGREELTYRLIQATIEDNPGRQFFGDW